MNKLYVLGCCAVLVACVGCEVADTIFSDRTTVEIVNNSSYEIEPGIYISDDNDLLDLALAQELSIGRIPSGNTNTLTYACDELGAIFSTEATQFNIFGEVEADDSDILLLDEDFSCGDKIVFEFTGDFGSFRVETSVE